MNKHKKANPIFTLVIVLLLAGCGSNSTDNGQKVPVEPTAVSQAATTPVKEQPTAPTATTFVPTDLPTEATEVADVTIPTTPTDESPTVATGGSEGSAKDAIILALHTQTAAKTLRGQSINAAASRQVTMTIEVVRPDRMHTTIDAGAFQREMINIGRIAYTKTPNGWVKSETPGDLAAMGTLNFIFADQAQVDAFVVENGDSWLNARLTGTEIINGISTKVYEFSVRSTITNGEETTYEDSPLKVWIGEADNLPYRFQSSSEVSVDGNDVMSTITYSFFDYNADITIDAPEVVVTP